MRIHRPIPLAFNLNLTTIIDHHLHLTNLQDLEEYHRPVPALHACTDLVLIYQETTNQKHLSFPTFNETGSPSLLLA